MNEGLFLSTCGGAISQTIDVEWLARQYGHLASVRVVEDFYAPNELEDLLAEVDAKHLDGLVLAGDSPNAFRETRNGEQLFRYFGERGIERNRIEVVNLRNMVVKPHNGAQRDLLQRKATVLIDVGLEKVRASQPVQVIEIAPRKAVAIVGATSGAVIAAQHLLDEGYKVALLHGGSDLVNALVGFAPLRPTLTAVLRHPRFSIYDEAATIDFCGYPGDFTLRAASRGIEFDLAIGAVILSLENNPALLREVQSVFHIDIDDEGFLAARDETTARSQTQDRGVFVINPVRVDGDGLASATIAADAAAAMAINLLNRTEITHRVTVSHVDASLCGGCGVCVKTCMFHAVTLRGDPPISVIDPRRCRGCGNCVTACPAEARDLLVCPSDYLSSAVDILAKFRDPQAGPSVLLIACDGCGYRCLDHAAESGLAWPVGILPLWVVCGGQIDTQLIMKAFARGFDGVALAICGEGCCHNLIGNVDLERRANLLREVLASRGIDDMRLKIVSTCSRKGKDCVEALNDFCSQLDGSSESSGTVLLTKRGSR